MPPLDFPFVCLDDNKNMLGPDDFVSGYTQIFVYGDGTANNNPVIGGASFNGPNIGADAGAGAAPDQDAGADVDAGAGADVSTMPYCIDGSCVPLVAPTSPAPDPCASIPKPLHVPACSGNCPTYEFSPAMDATNPKNNDIDVFQSDASGSIVGEQMWVNYYTDRGSLNHAVRLLRDAHLGWSSDFSDQWTPPSDPGPANLWAVAHDTRGGTAWVRLVICVD